MLDRQKLDASTAPTGLLRIDVLEEWLEEGGELIIDPPKRLTCAACDGGGCGRCENAGAFRVAVDEVEPIRLLLSPGPPEQKRVRIPSPFDDASTIELLVVELRPADEPSPGVERAMRRSLARVPSSAIAPAPMEPTKIIALVMGAFVIAVVLLLSVVMRSR